MTLGRSSRLRRTLSGALAASVQMAEAVALGWLAGRPQVRADVPRLARIFAGLHLGGLGILLMTAWRSSDAAGATIAGLPALHLAILMASGAAAAALTLIEPANLAAGQPDTLGSARSG